MVQIIRDHDVVRAENYGKVLNIMLPDYYIIPAGTSSIIYDPHGYPRGELFLHWDNEEIFIKGHPDDFWNTATKLERHGYAVTIKNPSKMKKINSSNIEGHALRDTISIIQKIKSSFW